IPVDSMKTVLPPVEEHHRHVPAVLCGRGVAGVAIALGHSPVPAGGPFGDGLARERARLAGDARAEGQLNHGSLLIGCNKPRREITRAGAQDRRLGLTTCCDAGDVSCEAACGASSSTYACGAS